MIHQAGQLNIRAILENPETVESVSGQWTEQYVAVQEIWIGIAAEGGGERMIADQMTAIGTFVVKMRRNSLITNRTRLRLKESDRVLYLQETPREAIERGGDWIAMVSEQQQPVEA